MEMGKGLCVRPHHHDIDTSLAIETIEAHVGARLDRLSFRRKYQGLFLSIRR